jgi:hypothetical protein
MSSSLSSEKGGSGAGASPGDETGSAPRAAEAGIGPAPRRRRAKIDTVPQRFCERPAAPTKRARGSTKLSLGGEESPPASLSGQRKGDDSMRSNSGSGKSSNNRGNPTLEEHERAHGRSGAAIQGEKKAGRSADRISTREKQSS